MSRLWASKIKSATDAMMVVEKFLEPDDDPAFPACVDRLVAGLTGAQTAEEIDLVRITNWFDHKKSMGTIHPNASPQMGGLGSIRNSDLCCHKLFLGGWPPMAFLSGGQRASIM